VTRGPRRSSSSSGARRSRPQAGGPEPVPPVTALTLEEKEAGGMADNRMLKKIQKDGRLPATAIPLRQWQGYPSFGITVLLHETDKAGGDIRR
jgi:hypothetical protein